MTVAESKKGCFFFAGVAAVMFLAFAQMAGCMDSRSVGGHLIANYGFEAYAGTALFLIAMYFFAKRIKETEEPIMKQAVVQVGLADLEALTRAAILLQKTPGVDLEELGLPPYLPFKDVVKRARLIVTLFNNVNQRTEDEKPASDT